MKGGRAPTVPLRPPSGDQAASAHCLVGDFGMRPWAATGGFLLENWGCFCLRQPNRVHPESYSLPSLRTVIGVCDRTAWWWRDGAYMYE
jgi:hypothetical protein